jgi:two-component system, chemotaxis family, chemotaxis protein CheY
MKFNVLVVDDSAAMRSIVIKTLNLSGVPIGEIFQAKNGAEALEILKDNWVDLALVDLNMPVMGGMEMISHVKADGDMADLAMMVVSTESSETRINDLKSQGVEFVHKPFSPQVLREKIIALTGVENAECTVSSDSFDF